MANGDKVQGWVKIVIAVIGLVISVQTGIVVKVLGAYYGHENRICQNEKEITRIDERGSQQVQNNTQLLKVMETKLEALNNKAIETQEIVVDIQKFLRNPGQ